MKKIDLGQTVNTLANVGVIAAILDFTVNPLRGIDFRLPQVELVIAGLEDHDFVRKAGARSVDVDGAAGRVFNDNEFHGHCHSA